MNAQEPAGLDRVVESIEQQIGWCRDFASPFTAMVLELIRDNLVRGGALVALVVPWPGEPMRDVLALRLAGVLQMMARTGLAPRILRTTARPGCGQSSKSGMSGRSSREQ